MTIFCLKGVTSLSCHKLTMKFSKLLLPAMSAIAVMPWSTLMAAEYSLTPAVNGQMIFDDNVLLTESATFSRIDEVNPSLQAKRQTEISSMAFTLGANIQRYSAFENLDDENPYINFYGNKSLERIEYNLTASYREDLARNDAALDSGQFASQARVISRQLAPSVTYNLTERDTLKASLTLDDRRYSTNQFSDNESQSWLLAWQRKVTERLTTGISINHVDYESFNDFEQSESHGQSASVIVNYDISETLQLSASAGGRKQTTETTTGQQSDSETSYGAVYDVSLRQLYEQSELTVTLARGLTPSSLGGVDEQDSLDINWVYAFSERLQFNLMATYIESTPTNTFNRDTREYLQIAPTLSWQLAEATALSLGYQFRQQKQSATDAQSNAVILGITHQWDNNRWSR